jgi:hypothetical protein
MAGRYRAGLGVAAVIGGLMAGVATIDAQEGATKPAAKWVVERTPEGKPDMQGVWANNTVTPLQRPQVWEGKTTLTDAEIAELQAVAKQIYENDGDAQFGDGLINAILEKITKPGSYDPGTGNYNQFWIAGRDWHDRRTAIITDPADGKIPAMTPEAEKRIAARREQRRAHAFEDPETFPLGERCVHFGIPRIGAGYNSYLQIVQTANHVMIMNEMAHDARVIPLDNRPWATNDNARPWNGESRAHWEGDTLVIETKNFSPKAEFMGATKDMRLTEKFTRVSKDVLNYEFTINDPNTWTRPWTGMIPLAHKDEMIFEYACHEANESVPNMLRGHRYEEKQAAEKKTSGGN